METGLRQAIFRAATVAARHDPRLTSFADRPGTAVLTAIVRTPIATAQALRKALGHELLRRTER